MRTTSSPSDKNITLPESEEKFNKKAFSRAGSRLSSSKEIEAIALSRNNGNSHFIVSYYGTELEKVIALWLPNLGPFSRLLGSHNIVLRMIVFLQIVHGKLFEQFA